ncbi:MAG TPA: hypothetical protein VEO01_40795 [Pseudonocardiaceae bacterium]|nr:hypothetical protein [Pseudonocardiaceae bacterium]
MDSVEARSANEPLDELDARILAGVRSLWDALDPVPSTLVDQIQFATQLESVDFEVLRLTERMRFEVARGEEQSRLITFDSDSLTIMIKIDLNRNGTVRVDGWLTPPASHPIELRVTDGSLTTTSDDGGRFALDGIEPGMAQLVVRPAGTVPGDQGRTVTTPSIVL